MLRLFLAAALGATILASTVGAQAQDSGRFAVGGNVHDDAKGFKYLPVAQLGLTYRL